VPIAGSLRQTYPDWQEEPQLARDEAKDPQKMTRELDELVHLRNIMLQIFSRKATLIFTQGWAILLIL
jgi:hypothetical protein